MPTDASIRDAIIRIRAVGLHEPSAIVMHPDDYRTLRRAASRQARTLRALQKYRKRRRGR